MPAPAKPYLDDAYPDVFRCLAVAAETELKRHYGEARAVAVAFEISEGVRKNTGGACIRMPAWKDEDRSGDLFGDAAPAPRPHKPPEVTINDRGSSVDMIAYATAWSAWIIASNDPDATGADIDTTSKAIGRRFHYDVQGRDLQYIPSGVGFEKRIMYRAIYADFNGHNYARLSLKYHLSEIRIRQIVTEMHAEEIARRQSRLDLDLPAAKAKK